MSRALDEDVLKFLSQSDPGKVYDDVARLLNSPQADGRPLEIEILGKAHPLVAEISFLIDENAVGIPKIRLFQAFSVAYKLFQRDHLQAGPRREDRNSTELLRSTAVLLLTDPEHLTAANSRKRAILRDIKDGSSVKALLEREKWFVDGLLTSRLHRHTKSPVLWSHRRWLLSQFQKHGLRVDVTLEIQAIILVSGERHPKNYYAWDHARWLVKSFVDGQADEMEGIRGMAADVKDWCLRHHDDVSGWAFLHFLLHRGGAELAADRSATFRDILQMAESFRWRNESVWWFIHAMAATNLLSTEDTALLDEIGWRMSGGLGPDGGLSGKWFRRFREARAI